VIDRGDNRPSPNFTVLERAFTHSVKDDERPIVNWRKIDARPVGPTIDIHEVGAQKFELIVTFDEQRFECTNYLNELRHRRPQGNLWHAKKASARAVRSRPG
jgi:hypothetical protein